MRMIDINYFKRYIITICYVFIILICTSCGYSKTDKDTSINIPVTEAEVETETNTDTEVDSLKETVFEKDKLYLKDKGIKLLELPSDSSVITETFLSLLVEAYEVLGEEIDISKVNPNSVYNDAVHKLTLLGVYENNFMVDNTLDSYLDYGTTAYWLMKIQDSLQKRIYWRIDDTAITDDLLRRINVSNALYTWTKDGVQVKTYTLDDLLEDNVASDHMLTRLIAAEMMVSAFEEISGEIPISQSTKFSDTNNINALKSSDMFFWPENGIFEPEKTGKWDDWSFLSAIIYDSTLRLELNLEEREIPYGAVVAAVSTLIRTYDELEQNVLEEAIVLNERPYDWYVYQQETGEYGAVNCMPSCVEMAMRYQGLTNVPSAEKLRSDNPLNGLGWNDVLAENTMLEYGLKFTDSFDINLDKMLNLLDTGNVLYVMYLEAGSDEGHSVIIKGYWQLGDNVKFIVSDPNYNFMGPFGYLEYTKDAQTILADMEIHVPRYFIIPAE